MPRHDKSMNEDRRQYVFDEDKLVIIQNKFQANIKFILTNV